MLPTINLNMTDPVAYKYLRNAPYSIEHCEERLARLYGRPKVFLTNSGMEAITTLIDCLIPKGGKVVINEDTYYETRQWLEMSERFEIDEVDCSDSAAVEAALIGADLLFFDNPSHFGTFYDVGWLTATAHRHGAKVIADNTLLGLHYERELRMNKDADYIIESYTKYVCGHGDCMAGGIVCKEVPPERMSVYIGRRGRVVHPFTAYCVERGLETLEVRMKRHTENARFVYEALRKEGIECWYSGYGSTIIIPGKTRDFANRLHIFAPNMTFGTTYSTSSAVRSADLYNRVGNYVRLHCGLDPDPALLVKDVFTALKEEALEVGEEKSTSNDTPSPD